MTTEEQGERGMHQELECPSVIEFPILGVHYARRSGWQCSPRRPYRIAASLVAAERSQSIARSEGFQSRWMLHF